MIRRVWVVWGIVAAIAAAAVLSVTGPASSSRGDSSGRTSNVVRPPQIVRVEYGRFRPDGADRSYMAIRVKARDPNGEIVVMEAEGIGHADGGCGLGDSRTGRATTWTLPATLSPGRHRLRLTVESSSCDRRKISEATTGTFSLTVRG